MCRYQADAKGWFRDRYAEEGSSTEPIHNQPGEAHQCMPQVDQALQPGAEEVVLRLGSGRLGTHRWAPGEGVRRGNHVLPCAAMGKTVCKVSSADRH